MEQAAEGSKFEVRSPKQIRRNGKAEKRLAVRREKPAVILNGGLGGFANQAGVKDR